MSVHAGPSDWWTDNTDAGRTHIAKKGVVQTGLVLNLDAGVSSSYPGSGTSWYDLSGNGNIATLNNGPTYSSIAGGNIVFDGANDTYTLGAFRIGQTSSFTISCWFKRNILSNMNNKYILKTPDAGPGRVFFGVIDEGGAYGSLYNNTYYGSGRDYWQKITSEFKNTNWCELVLVHNKVDLFQKSYFNGVETNNTTLSGTLDTTNQALSGTEINASISNLKIYNRALTAAEIQQNFNAQRRRYGI